MVLAVTLAISMPMPGGALEIPTTAARDNRVRFVTYQPYDVTRIVGSLLSSVQLEFSEDEEIAHVAIGNSVAWEVAPAGHILFLKPREAQPITNLSVVTIRADGRTRSYQLELTVRDGAVEQGQNTYFYVKYRYPADEAEKRRLTQLAARQTAAGNAVEARLLQDAASGRRNWRYSAQGASSLEPRAVYDNGRVTSFAFRPGQSMPAIYVEAPDGSESLIPKSVSGDLVVIHTVARKFVLRYGHEVLCIFRDDSVDDASQVDSPLDAGANLTVSPQVKRVARRGSSNAPAPDVGGQDGK
jgi:type IV secretion system protein VirB9